MDQRKIIVMLLGVVVYLNITIGSSHLLAQAGQSAVDNAPENQETDAIKCWWRSDKSSVRVGENLLVILTCRVVESGSVKVIPNENALEMSVISLKPYNVLKSTKNRSISKGSFRFFQYQYLLNIVDEGYFGKDAPVPSLDIGYKIERKITQLENIDTRDKVYKMPELSMKIQSLISKNTNDIRDTGSETFGNIQDRRFRANIAIVLASLLFVIPLVVMSLPLVRALHRLRKKHFNGTLFSTQKLLRRVLGELKKIEQARKNSDWESELVGRVVTIFRIAGAIGLSRNVSQLSVLFETKGLEGQLKLKKGLFGSAKVLISSSLTPEAMKESINEGRSIKWNKDFLEVFETFNCARYSTDPIDAQRLDGALSRGIGLIQKLRRQNFGDEDGSRILEFGG